MSSRTGAARVSQLEKALTASLSAQSERYGAHPLLQDVSPVNPSPPLPQLLRGQVRPDMDSAAKTRNTPLSVIS